MSNTPLIYKKYKGTDGFMSWHTNCNEPGRRWHIIYNTEEGSKFNYVNNNTGVMHTKIEPKGWYCYWADFGECEGILNNTPLWHSIKSKGVRFTLGFREFNKNYCW